jgi:hypothetical protein
VLVVQLTWGPELFPAAEVAKAWNEAAAFVERSSRGQATLDVTIAAPLAMARYECNTGSPLLEANFVQARAPALAAGYPLDAYDRVAFMIPGPDNGCPNTSFGVGREALLVGTLGPMAIVHELGHTWGLGHANTPGREYGDPWTPMGHGGDDFSPWEKVELGWATAQRAAPRATYTLRPRTALLVGDYVVEYRTQPFRWVLVRKIVGNTTVLLPPLRDGRIVLGGAVLRVSKRLAGSVRIDLR